jgi:PAS domain S-box-containing protein
MKPESTRWSDVLPVPRPLVAALHVTGFGLVIALVVARDGLATAASVVVAAAAYVAWYQHHRGASALRAAAAPARETPSRRASGSERTLQETCSLLRTVLDSAVEVSIIATDPELMIKVFNAGAERLLGYRSEELVGRVTPLLLYDSEEVNASSRLLYEATGRRVDGWELFVEPTMLNKPHQWTYLCKDGRRITVSQVVTAMYTDSGSLMGYLSVAHDVTQQKQCEESLREATQKAEQASRAKSEFLANMSHEIRTPMNAVIGLSYLLGQTALDSQQSAVLGNINHASKTLLSVINDVLDLSKIEAGELIVERVAFSPAELIQQLVDVATIQANAKGVIFRVDLPPDMPPLLEGDAKHLNQILSNLLSNAVRFTDRGMVELRVALARATAETVTMTFSVQDTGIGISPEAQSRLFAPFAQADATITRRYGGTGLGLSIVKSLVNLLGGSVQLKSTPGVGSEFTVVLEFALASAPASEAAQPNRPELGEQRLANVRILVVDDSEINLEVTRRILELNGAKVTLAHNGREAFELLRARADGYDVVLMDVQMPVLDGYAATQQIRETLALPHLPVIALTAGALSSERERAVASGMDDFIVKPFDANTLVGSILRHVKGERQAGMIESAAVVPVCGTDRGWPLLPGIDIEDARQRLTGDLNLFLSGMRRLLREYGDLQTSFVKRDAEEAILQAQRMHKLKGTAGMLGAKVIEQLARRAEAAFKAGDFGEASGTVKVLAVELRRLGQSAAAVLASGAIEEPSANHAAKAAPLDAELLAKLLDLLRRQDLAAVDLFNSMEAALSRNLGRRTFESVRELVDQLLLIEAADLLSKHRQ